MKKNITLLLFVVMFANFQSMAQLGIVKKLHLPFTKKEIGKTNPHTLFFYDVTLSNGRDIVADGFDLGFYTSTYDILEANGFLDSIFVRENEKQMLSIDTMTWTYSCDFVVSKEQMKKDFAYLTAENVDGNASLYINNKKVREYHNSFVTSYDDVKSFLKKGKNSLRLVFTPKDNIRMRQRSPQYLYGWDWYPQTLAPSINAFYISFEDDKPMLDQKNIQTKSIGENKAEMTLGLKFRKPLTKEHTITLNSENFDKHFTLQPNNTGEYSLDFEIDNPKLWWPNGSGEQNMYRCSVYVDNNEESYAEMRFGVRKIELVRQDDQYGQSFFFKVNGKPVFCKGANYIADRKVRKQDIEYARQANMNMLRIWGGSNYGDEEFYSLCDENGIMVWQDFPFACELYPADSAFLENVRQEAVQNVMRISSHPSLALYCGNNEIWEGWYNWGWKQTTADTLKAVQDYDKLFRKLLPEVVSKYAPTTDYIHSSPVAYGWGHQESRTIGDCHYWGVWWADSAFEAYAHKVPRFMSEYGFQSAMNLSTAQRYCSLPYTKDNPSFALHQKHDRGFALVENRVKEWFGDYCKTDEDYISFSQLTQQEALKLAIEFHRMKKPYCMGTLFWQYNELYPCIGWGCLDYSGYPKPVYYTASLGFEPVIFCVDRYSDSDSVFVYVSSDSDREVNLAYSLKILDEKDSLHYRYIQDSVTVKPNCSQKIASIAYKDIRDFDKKRCYMWIGGIYDKHDISNYSFFTLPKDYVSMDKYLQVVQDYYFEDGDDMLDD